jgi:glycosyltransferase involved in cell wall biosynthesis
LPEVTNLDFDIIFLALPRWDAPYSSTALSLAKALSKKTRVFYVDNPLTLAEFIRKRNTAELQVRREALFGNEDPVSNPDPEHPNLFRVISRVSLPVNWLPDGIFYDFVSKINDSRLSATLNEIISGKNVKRYILVNSFNPLYGNSLKLSVEPILKVYQCVDDIRQAPYISKHGTRLEESHVRSADFTIATASALVQKLRKFSSEIFLLPNAANTVMFNAAVKMDLRKPKEFDGIPEGKKVIVYIGNLCQRLDYDLIKKIAEAHPDKHLLLIGPHSIKPGGKGFYFDNNSISALDNVTLVGARKLEELPAYLQHAHCGIIPFLCNDLTKSIYPLKVNEYLSAGLPVVSTAFSDDILSFREVVRIAENHQQFVYAIDKVIEENSHARKIERMMFSASNSWEARAYGFIELVVEFLKHHDRRTGLLQRRDRKQTVNRQQS